MGKYVRIDNGDGTFRHVPAERAVKFEKPKSPRRAAKKATAKPDSDEVEDARTEA